jgi:periplasmic copper chaperone A
MLVLLLLAASALVPSAAPAHNHKKKGFEIVHPWTPAMLEAGIANIPVYMTLKNSRPTADRLVGAASPLARTVELIEPRDVGSFKLPTQVTALAVGPGATLELNATGPRLLLRDVKKQLHAYDSFKLTLVFAKAGRIVVDVLVEEGDAPAPHKH